MVSLTTSVCVAAVMVVTPNNTVSVAAVSVEVSVNKAVSTALSTTVRVCVKVLYSALTWVPKQAIRRSGNILHSRWRHSIDEVGRAVGKSSLSIARDNGYSTPQVLVRYR